MRKYLVVLTAILALLGTGVATASATPGRSASGLGVFKGRTEVTLDPAAAAALDSLGVKVVPLLASVRTEGGKSRFGFPIVGNPSDGTIEHIGGLLLYSNSAYIALTNYTIDLNRGVLTGKVNFRSRVDLFTLGAATPDGVALALTAGAAQALNSTFGVSAFAEGLIIGYGNPRLRS